MIVLQIPLGLHNIRAATAFSAIIKIRKKSHTPTLSGLKKLDKPFAVTWLNT